VYPNSFEASCLHVEQHVCWSSWNRNGNKRVVECETVSQGIFITALACCRCSRSFVLVDRLRKRCRMIQSHFA
jgi:hypothetical protein